jgi:hypothetical protein
MISDDTEPIMHMEPLKAVSVSTTRLVRLTTC